MVMAIRRRQRSGREKRTIDPSRPRAREYYGEGRMGVTVLLDERKTVADFHELFFAGDLSWCLAPKFEQRYAFGSYST
jgi:hypothetical protein